MANKEALRDLQSRLAERLKVVRSQPQGTSWLAVECSGRGFLLPLQEAGEIFPQTTIVPVAHTKPWFLGVANLRVDEPTECLSGLVLQGKIKPHECPAFGTRCTPEHPLGATMVSSEGACAAYYRYRREPATTAR